MNLPAFAFDKQPLVAFLRKSPLRGTLLLFVTVFVLGCTTTAPDPRSAFANRYGKVDFVRDLGDFRYTRHSRDWYDIKSFLNPQITILSADNSVSHGYLADVIDSLGTIEANYRAQKARWLSIDFYGLTLGSNISEYPNLFGTFLNNSGDGKDSLLDNSQITSQLPDAAKALGEIDLVALKKDYSNHMHSQKDYIVQNVTNRAARNELLDHLVKLRTASWSSTYQKYQEARYHYLRADLEYQLRLAANLSENWDLNNRRGYLEKETGLVAIPAKGSMHGWDSLVVEVGKHGTLEGIQFLKKFENSRNVTDFYFALRDELSRKFSPLNGETGSFNDSGYYILYGIPNETIYNARIKDLTLTSLEDFIKVENAFEADPYIINKSLDCIRVFYDVDHSVVWLSVESFVARLAKEGGNNSTLNGM